MKVSVLTLVLLLAAIVLGIGIIFPFLNLGFLNPKYDNTEYVTAMFSLSGILFFCAALIYQIKEYKLQVDELRKSVEAQTKSSAALEEQKLLLLEQNTNDLIFKMIDSFNQFKKDKLIQESIEMLHTNSGNAFQRYRLSIVTSNLSKEKYNHELAHGIKGKFTEIVKADMNVFRIKKFVQFAYNILYLIDQKKIPNQKDWFTPFFHIHLSKEESLVLHLSNLVDYGMPLSNNIQWYATSVSDLIEIIYPAKDSHQDVLLDINILIEELNRIKQRL